jgi:hypothetical protein
MPQSGQAVAHRRRDQVELRGIIAAMAMVMEES